jgi:hypothetical protein
VGGSENVRSGAVKGRYADVWSETLSAEEAIREARRVERSYREMLGTTDRLLGQLEVMNLSGRRELDDRTRRRIERTLRAVTPEARDRFPGATSVQQALDGVFEVQEQLLVTLQRMLHWDRLAAAPWAADLGGEVTSDTAVRRSA